MTYDLPDARAIRGGLGREWRQFESQRQAASQFVRRHGEQCHDLTQSDRGIRRQFADRLLGRVAHPLNLFAAVRKQRLKGVKAAGKSGLDLTKLHSAEISSLIDAIREHLPRGGVHTQPPRTVKVPKASGRGTRTISIFNHEDAVVHRAYLQILRPFFDPLLRATVYPRPQFGLDHAVSKLKRLVEEQGRRFVICNDLQDAFGSIPIDRLRSQLTSHLPERLVRAILNTFPSLSKRGLPQGHALSPLMLDILLNRGFDQRWSKEHPRDPLLRYVDDLMVVFRTSASAESMAERFAELVVSNGFRLKYDLEVHDLAADPGVEWLGFTFRLTPSGALAIGIGANRWARLEQSLIKAQAVEQTDTPARRVFGWFSALGPVSRERSEESVLSRVEEILRRRRMKRALVLTDMLGAWKNANARFQAVHSSPLKRI